MAREQVTGPEPLDGRHATAGFDCGVPELDEYLVSRALADQRAEKSRTYVAVRGRRVVAYFSLAAANVQAENATERLARGQGGQPIPAILLARLAVDVSEQGAGLGEAMLVEALARSAQAADVVGARAVVVHAKDERARTFYEKYGFARSPTSPMDLVMLMKDIRKTLSG